MCVCGVVFIVVIVESKLSVARFITAILFLDVFDGVHTVASILVRSLLRGQVRLILLAVSKTR